MSKISVVTLSILGKNIFIFRLENFFNKGENYVYTSWVFLGDFFGPDF
jgi:hypothetical protein